jgi:hypothetical protein
VPIADIRDYIANLDKQKVEYAWLYKIRKERVKLSSPSVVLSFYKHDGVTLDRTINSVITADWLATFKHLLGKKGVIPQTEFHEYLCIASCFRSIKITQYLLDIGVEPDTEALYSACLSSKDNTKIIKLLLQRNINIIRDNDLLFSAIYSKCIPNIKLLLANGIPIHPDAISVAREHNIDLASLAEEVGRRI